MSDDTPVITAGEHEDPSSDAVTTKLREYGASEEAIGSIKNDLGVTTLEDLALLTEADLVGAGLKLVPARRLLQSLNPATVSADTAAVSTVQIDSVLPAVMDDGSWLEALRSGGVLKVGQPTVMAAIRAALATRVGLYEVPGLLLAAMEAFAEKSEEQVDPVFYEMRALLTRRSYADVFSAIKGLDGNFVTEARKKQLFRRIDDHLWPAILAFYNQLKNWQEAWLQGANPAMMLAAFASFGGGTGLPPGVMQPPDTGALRDQAAAVADAVNRVFAAFGVQIAAALASEATQIRTTLEDPRLPGLIGVANRDQMLRHLGVAISPAYTRLETNLTRFVLAILQAQEQPADTEVRYYGTLFMLASQITWPELSGKQATSLYKDVTAIGGAKAAITGGPRQIPLDTGYSAGTKPVYDDPLGPRYR